MQHGFEWVVIDGGGDRAALDAALAGGRPPDTVVCEPDEGIYAAMDKGVRLARGRYVQFLNSGDTLLDSSVIGDLLSCLGALDGEVLVARTRKGSIDWPQFPVSPLRHLLGIQMHAHPSLLAPRLSLIALGGFRRRYGFAADFDLAARLLLSHESVQSERVIVAFHPDGISQRSARQVPKLVARIRRDILRPDGFFGAALVAVDFALGARYQFARLTNGVNRRRNG